MPDVQVSTTDTTLFPRPGSSISLSALWTGASTAKAIADEAALLKTYVRTPFRIGRVPIDLPKLGLGRQHINTLDINHDALDEAPIVWLHGAGAGLGFGYRNYDALASLGGVRRRVLGVDWLGAAGSSRPSFPYGGLRKPVWALSEKEQIDAALDFSIDSLEAWRAALGIQAMDLVAHSMGGYLATQYALRYPTRVRRLVLVSPVGWAERPQGEAAQGRAGGLFGALWDASLGNFGSLRFLGRCASGVASGAVVGRFGIRDPAEEQLVGNYFWSQLTSQPISAEKNVNFLLEPFFAPAPFGFYAKRPVASEPAERLARLPPTTLLYGSHDLHYIPTMPQAVKRVAAAATNPITMAYVRRSDHHLYIDNPPEFHAHVAKALA